MVSKKKIKLNEEQIHILTKLPEQGMGYQIVDIKLKDGKVFNKRVVLNSTYLQIEEGEIINPNEIVSISLHKP